MEVILRHQKEIHQESKEITREAERGTVRGERNSAGGDATTTPSRSAASRHRRWFTEKKRRSPREGDRDRTTNRGKEGGPIPITVELQGRLCRGASQSPPCSRKLLSTPNREGEEELGGGRDRGWRNSDGDGVRCRLCSWSSPLPPPEKGAVTDATGATTDLTRSFHCYLGSALPYL
ncbi:hypothetical protein PIB30_053715 [Stylosanthes scabra]|uniref:Uncharacterized protein n=1 Tax=Stylosanthes scabra TaxID=79078 RepID=A0ABU6SIQ3_9FABA|nr:hypothetical protein [Stylosanthes scabra]